MQSTPEPAGEVVDDYAVTCYIVNEEEIIADGEEPHVVCTGEPEEVRFYIHCIGSHLYNHDLNQAHLMSSLQICFASVRLVQWYRSQNDGKDRWCY